MKERECQRTREEDCDSYHHWGLERHKDTRERVNLQVQTTGASETARRRVSTREKGAHGAYMKVERLVAIGASAAVDNHSVPQTREGEFMPSANQRTH